MRQTGFRRWLPVALLAMLGGCSSEQGFGPETHVDPQGAGPTDATFQQQLRAALDEAKTLSVTDFVARWTPADAAEAFPLSYDPLESEHVKLIDMALGLDDGERAKLQENGFVVSERLSYESFGAAMLDVYHKDLPVMITADMILQALHSSYDSILMQTELDVLLPTVRDALLATRAALPGFDAQTAAAQDAREDCDMYLTVALSLLDGEQVPSLGGAVDAQVTDFLAKIAALSMSDVQVFGVARKMDFSQFEPRGHYEELPDLQHYFRAMMWLGRVDLRFLEQDRETGAWVFHDRQLADSWLLAAAARESGASEGLAVADRILRALIGEVDYITRLGVEGLSEAHGLDTLAKASAIDDATRAALTDELLAGAWGEQKINSHWLETDPFSAEPTPLPPAFAFFGQRFTVDSYVFSNVVYDTIVANGKKMPRRLPSPLDALFVLGNDQVLPHLAGELDAWQYQGNLHSLRFLVDWYDADFWSANVYNLWLSALRGMNAPTTAALYPEPMRTPAWRDRIINTQMGSWAQLRHDTLLYVKQSYTGGAGCDYPDAWVDAYPELWAALETLGDRMTAAVAGTPADQQVGAFFANWKSVMGTLRSISEKEIDGTPLSEEDRTFLKGAAMEESAGCVTTLTGWYQGLFWLGADAALEWKPTIADVHTNPSEDGPLAPPDVLHVATGKPNLMVFTAETCDGARAFVGPVFSAYEVLPGGLERYTDSDWAAMLQGGQTPARPAWTKSFLAPVD